MESEAMTFEVHSRFLSAFIKMADACRHIDTTAARRRRVRAETCCVAAVFCEQSEELHAIHDALRRLRGISYAVYIILCILTGLALRVLFWG
jgi:hypothetical protein